MIQDAITVPTGQDADRGGRPNRRVSRVRRIGITVNGTLKANGTVATPIIFTSTRDDSVGADAYNDTFDGNHQPDAGQWDSLTFTATSTSNVLDHVEVRYGGNSSAGEVFDNGGPLSLTNSTLLEFQHRGDSDRWQQPRPDQRCL